MPDLDLLAMDQRMFSVSESLVNPWKVPKLLLPPMDLLMNWRKLFDMERYTLRFDSPFKLSDVLARLVVEDWSMGEDLSNPDTVTAFVNRVARRQDDFRRKNKELRVTAPLDLRLLGPLIEMGFNKIDKLTPTYIVLKEDKSRAQEDHSHQKTNLTSAIDLHEVASDVTLMPRETIASSSKPCNLICSHSPDATLAVVQTLSETACEQGLELQSSRALPSGPAGMGNNNEAAGFQGFSAEPEIPECGVQSKKRPHPANESDGLPSTRRRVPDFEDEEIGLLLQFKLEYLQDPANEGKRRKWLMPVTEKMKHKGYDRGSVAWRGVWDMLKRTCNALKSKSSQGTGYWDLMMDQKVAIKKFPRTFKLGWVAAMENIEKMESRSAAGKETRRDGQEVAFTQSLSSPKFTEPGSAIFAGADCLEELGDEPDSESEAGDIPTDEEVSSGESGAAVESHTEIASADNHGPRTEPSRKRSAASAFDEDSLFAKIRPFVYQQIEEALLPLISALRSREEDEHKHRQKMLALEREKLALMRQKLECTRRSNAVPASVAK